MDLIQKLIEMPDKDIKKPDNKSLFADDNLYREMFSKGEIKAQALYKELEERSRIAGAFTEFKRRYMEHKKEFIKRAEGLSDTKKIDILDLPALNIPSGYKLDMNQGILKFNETTLMFEQICPQIVIIEARYINIDSGEEKNKVTFIDRFKTKSLIVDAETVSNSRSIVKLRNMGIMVTSENAKSIVVFLSEFLACNIFHIEPEDSISRIGWHDGEFIPYNSTCIFDGEQENKHLFEALDTKGELSDWIDYVKELRKNKLFRMQLASSFSSPLIEITNSLPFVFHLWGGTGSGKTVGLMVAMSIWGNPAMGKLVRTMNMTQNSMMTTASFLYNIPFAGDELQIIKSRWTNYDNLIMAITEGVDRGRMDGHVNRSLKRWHCNFLFTGEEPCTNNNSGGGTRNRVIEIECTSKIVDKGNETVNFIKQNYGLAGREFLEHIKEYDIQKEYISLMNQLIANSKTTEKQAMSLALILLADKITSEKMFNDEPLKISDVVEYLKDDADVDVSVRAFSFITDWFTINQQCFSGETENLAASKQIYGRIDSKNENLVYVVNTALKDALHSNGFSFDSVAGKWKERGWLLPNTQGRNVHNTRINGKKANCYKLNFDTIEEQTCMNGIEMIEEIPF